MWKIVDLWISVGDVTKVPTVIPGWTGAPLGENGGPQAHSWGFNITPDKVNSSYIIQPGVSSAAWREVREPTVPDLKLVRNIVNQQTRAKKLNCIAKKYYIYAALAPSRLLLGAAGTHDQM